MTDIRQEYAAALFALTREAGTEAETAAALNMVAAVLRDNPAYTELLAAPHLSKDDRAAAVREAFGDAVPPVVTAFLELLCRQERIREADECIAAYDALYEQAHHVSVAQVRAAVPLNEEQKARLRHKLEQICGNAVRLDCTVDETLIGGVTVEVDGKTLDGSVRHRLHEWKEGNDQ